MHNHCINTLFNLESSLQSSHNFHQQKRLFAANLLCHLNVQLFILSWGNKIDLGILSFPTCIGNSLLNTLYGSMVVIFIVLKALSYHFM